MVPPKDEPQQIPTEEAVEALLRAIADACDASMLRRPSTYHRKPVYWWNEELAGLRNECNKRRRNFQRARKANRPNAIEEQETYKEARRILRITIRKCKTESGKNLIVTINGDPWGLPYKIVMDKLRRSQGSRMRKTRKSTENCGNTIFVFSKLSKPRTRKGEPFSPKSLRHQRADDPLAKVRD